jgi:hypothetical protein
MEEFKMSEFVPDPGSLMVSKEVHDFMFSLCYNRKEPSVGNVLKLFPSKSNVEIFKLGFAIGYVLNLEPVEVPRKQDISIRGFPLDAYRTFLEDEAISTTSTIGSLLSTYADAGLRFLKSHIESGKDISQVFEIINK